MAFDNIDQRIKRWTQAERERQLKLNKFVQAYRLSFPMRDKWLIQGDGSLSYDKTMFRWDTTAVTGLKAFASNLQTLLMPNFKQWARFTGAKKYSPTAQRQLDEMLETPSNILFSALEASNLMLEANVSFQDMGIAVGLLQIRSTGDKRAPISFQSIPMHTVALGQVNGEIKDVYRKMTIPVRDIRTIWPDASISDQIQQRINTAPGSDIDLLEGTIYYPQNKPSERYQYFVTELATKTDIVMRKQSMSRWIPFRFAVSPGEVWGDGPVLQILDSIRIANKIAELDVINAGIKIARPLIVNGSKVLNPNNIKMEAGAIFYVNDLQPGQLPIVPLDVAGDFTFDQITLKGYQDEIKEALFSDPMGPQQGPNTSATEVSIRQQNWIKRSASSMGRLSNELLKPIILKSAVLLQEQGLFPHDFHIDPETMDIKIEGQDVEVDFLSPLATIEDTEEAHTFSAFNQQLQAVLGPQLSMAALNLEQIPQFLAEKMNVDQTLVKGADAIALMQQQMMQAQQQQQQAQQQAASQPPVKTQPLQQNAQLSPIDVGQ